MALDYWFNDKPTCSLKLFQRIEPKQGERDQKRSRSKGLCGFIEFTVRAET